MKFMWAVLLVISTIFGQTGQPAKAVPPIAPAFDTATYKLQMEVDALRKEIQAANALNAQILAIGQKAADHVDNTLLGIFGLFIVIGALGWRASKNEAANLAKGVQLDVKETLDAAQESYRTDTDNLLERFKADSTKRNQLIDQMATDQKAGLQSMQGNLEEVLVRRIDKTLNEMKEELSEVVGKNTLEIKVMNLTHLLFKMNIYLKLNKPGSFCKALEDYYNFCLTIGDSGELDKAYDDVIRYIARFLNKYADQPHKITDGQKKILLTFTKAIGERFEQDISKQIGIIEAIQPLEELSLVFGNPWEGYHPED